MTKYGVTFIKNEIHHEVRVLAHSKSEAVQQILDRFAGATDIEITTVEDNFNVYIVDFQKKVLLKRVPGNY